MTKKKDKLLMIEKYLGQDEAMDAEYFLSPKMIAEIETALKDVKKGNTSAHPNTEVDLDIWLDKLDGLIARSTNARK
ncbi:MAG: hypothetical protein ACKVOR_14025 [Flavobacteriales bacterium]